MSRKTNISYLFILALLLFASCDKEISPTSPLDNGEKPVEIRLSTRMAQVSASVTRNENFIEDNETLPQEAKLGVYGLRKKDDSFAPTKAHFANVLFTTPAANYGRENISLSSANTIYFPAGTNIAYLYAYYPYVDSPTVTNGKATIPVRSSLHTIEGDGTLPTDPLYTGSVQATKNKVDESTPAQPVEVSLPLQHAMARLIINIRLTEESQKTCMLQAVTIVFKHEQKGEMSLNDGNITSKAIETTYNVMTGETQLTMDGISYDHTVLPATDAIAKISITVNGEIFTAYDGSNGSIRLESAHKRTVNITFNPTLSTKAAMGNWTNDNSNDFEAKPETN